MSAEAAARRLVLVRHGQTSWNAERRFQGHADVELDEVGHAQAAAVAPLVARSGPVALWASDLARARQTAAYVEEATGLVARLDPRLREFDVGERVGLTWAEYQQRADSLDPGETPADVVARIRPALDDLLGSLAGAGTAVVVSHGGCLRLAVASLLGWDPASAASLGSLRNCGVVVLRERPGQPTWALDAWNLTPDFAPLVGGG